METVSLRVANWENSEVDETCYSASIKVPRKQELLNLLPHHLEKMQYNIKFVTGILANVGHSITLCIFREYNEPRLGLFVTLGKHPEKIVEVKMIDANYVALDQANIEYSLSRCSHPKDLEVPAENIGITHEDIGNTIEFWTSTCGWHDETAMIFLTFHVVCRKPPNIINEEEEGLLCTPSSMANIDITNFFMNEKFSDVCIICQSVRFPAHRLILVQVEYFNMLLTVQMKESLDGIITVDDVNPTTYKELLRFIYQGKIEDLSACVTELYSVADKYGITRLKGICEQHLYTNLKYENALEIFDLSNMHGSLVLAKRAKELIISNKDKFAPDAETFKMFTSKYPDLAFQLFKMLT